MAALTALAVASFAVGAASTGMSIAQANKQSKLKKEADRKATQAVADAKKEIDVNYMNQLSAAKKPFELARKNVLSTGSQALEAGKESDERGSSGTAGRVVYGMEEGQQKIAASMEEEIKRLDLLSAQEDANIATKLAGLDLSTATGAQLASRDAEWAKNEAIKQAIATGASTAVGGVEDFVSLYSGDKTGSSKKDIDFNEDLLGTPTQKQSRNLFDLSRYSLNPYLNPKGDSEKFRERY
jgi:vacuolar-type H+-ATPase subunit H